MYDIYEHLEKETKDYVVQLLEDAQYHPEDVEKIRLIAFGALSFSANRLFPCFNRNLMNWWNDEILPQFREIGA